MVVKKKKRVKKQIILKSESILFPDGGLRILTLDPATLTTGWAFMKYEKDKEPELLAYGHFDIPKEAAFPERMFFVRQKVLVLINQLRPTNLIIEKPFMGPNVDTFMKLSGVYGVISAVSHEKSLPLISMVPSEAKIFFVGTARMKGAESKILIKKHLEGIYDVKFAKNDESDAISVGLTGIKKYLMNGVQVKSD